MAKKKKQSRAAKQSPSPAAATPVVAARGLAERRRTYLVLAALGAVAAAWALFLWRELIAARTSGATPFCAFGDDASCGALWDGAFASGVHSATGLPVAAWGLVWGIVALGLPLAGWLRTAPGPSAWIPGGVAWTALAGAGGVVGLLAASAAAGLFCTSCAVTYVVTVAYVVVAWRADLRPTARGVAAALLVLAPAYLVLLGPGRSTPKSAAAAERDALADAVAKAAGSDAAATDPGAAQQPATPPPSYPTPPPPARTAANDQALEGFVQALDPRFRQALSDALEIYRHETPQPMEPPRELHFAPGASLRLTTFSDTLCTHCATLHETVDQLVARLPPGTFSLDARHYPLDGACNPRLPAQGGAEGVRCLAARARICLEGKPGAHEFAGDLYRSQQRLTESLVYQLATRYLSPAVLDRCVVSPVTGAKLATDINYAARYDITGTPVVTVNGREGPAFGVFLYAILLAAGDPDHPAFADLPEPAEPTGHEGHDH